ncbi:MAG TPA: hypothetical protein VL201_05630, partial [Patescibacteria group bacterium]|nr:hypothetical protein [Patescibacteria group bacterium]
TIKECFLVDNIPFISLYKYRNYKVFTDDPVTYFLNVMEQNWYSQICDLNRSQWHAKLNVHTLLKKNFRIEKELIKNFQLRIYLVKDRPKFLVFHRDELYEDFSLFCQKIGTKLYNKALRKDDCMISICQDLQKECENKKSLSTEKVSALLKLLYNDSLKGNHKKEFNECDAPLLHEIILFLKQATIYNPVNICFGFLFSKDIDCERPYFEIIKSLNNDLGNKNESRRNLDIDKEVFFSFIEKTFNDYSSKTDKIISACKILQLKQSDEIFKNSPLSNILNVDYYVNFEIQNNSNGMSDESIIPLDLLDY